MGGMTDECQRMSGTYVKRLTLKSLKAANGN